MDENRNGNTQIATRKLRGPMKTHGGKHYLVRRIIALFPPHVRFVEPYAGGLSVLLNKTPASYEIAGDVNPDLIGFWRVLRNQGDELKDRLRVCLAHAQETFKFRRSLWASGASHRADVSALDRAVNYVAWNRMSRGGLGTDFAWSERLRGGQPGDLNGWETFLDLLPAIRERVAEVEFRSAHAVDLMQKHDGPEIYYVDPPYLPETRSHREAYPFEMTRDDHVILLDAILGLRGKRFLSGYPSDLYDRALKGWTRHTFDIANHSAGQGEAAAAGVCVGVTVKPRT